MIPHNLVDLAPVTIVPLSPRFFNFPGLAAEEIIVEGTEIKSGTVMANGIQSFRDAGPAREDAPRVGAKAYNITELSSLLVTFEDGYFRAAFPAFDSGGETCEAGTYNQDC
jgi:hypothetical protein